MIIINENTEFQVYKPTESQKHNLRLAGFTTIISKSITAFKVIDSDVIFRLHNGSMYKFIGVSDWWEKTFLTRVSSDDDLGKAIRKKTKYVFCGVLSLEGDLDLSDKELIFNQQSGSLLDKTIKNDQYHNQEQVVQMYFYGPNDASILGFCFNLTCRVQLAVDEIDKFFLGIKNSNSTNITIDLGRICIKRIIESNPKKYTYLEIISDEDTINAIDYVRKVYGEKIEIIFLNPQKSIVE